LKHLNFQIETLEIMDSMTPCRRIQLRLVRLTAVLIGEHGIVDLKDALSGAVVAVDLLILLPDDGELVEDIGHGITRLREVTLEHRQFLQCLALGLAPATVGLARRIEVEESGVQFAADLEAQGSSQGNSGPSDPQCRAKGVKS
jgi:hypothetical protein